MPRVKAEYGENESVGFMLPSLSVFISHWKGYIINAVWITPYVSKEIGTVFDLFDMEGRLIHSLKLVERIWPHYLDKHEKLYCLVRDENEVEKVVRYRLSF